MPSTVPVAQPPEPAPAAPAAIPLEHLLSRERATPAPPAPVREIGGRSDGPEPTRYGDWEKNGRCIDF